MKTRCNFRLATGLSATGLAIAVGIGCMLACAAHAQDDLRSIHVGKHGVESNPGTAEQPVATVEKAVQLIDGAKVAGEVVIHGGEYGISRPVWIQRSGTAPIVIRPAKNAEGKDEEVVFDGGILADDIAAPLENVPGVFTVKGTFPSDLPPEMVEETTGIQFARLAGLDSVRLKDYSCTVLDRTTLAFRGRNGDSPKGRKIRLSQVNYGFTLSRDNVTVKGITFRNFNMGRFSAAIIVGDNVPLDSPDVTRNAVIDGCSSVNCYKGFAVNNSGTNTVITRCRVLNPVTGIINNGVSTTIEHCTILNDYGRIHTAPGAFSPIEADGIRIYYHAKNTVVRHNFIKGFRTGFFFKSAASPTIIENNTLVYGQPAYIEGLNACALRPIMGAEFRCLYNIFVGFQTAIADVSEIPRGVPADFWNSNVFWSSQFNGALQSGINAQKARGIGPGNLVADPLFAAPGKDDYRLTDGSPAIGIADGKNAGAFDVSPKDFKRETDVSFAGPEAGKTIPKPHTVEVIGEPKVIANRYGALVFLETDPPVPAKLEYQDGDKWVEAANSSYVAGGGFPRKFLETSTFPLLITGLQADVEHRYRLTLSMPDRKITREGTLVLAGSPKILHVSMDGKDVEDGGSRSHPFKTLQFAFDRALPGDRVRILPGTYLGTQILNHGGTREHPLIIEGLYPNTVTLDALGQEANVVAVRHAPGVILRNLNVRWSAEDLISIHDSPGIRVTHCRFQNQYWLTDEMCMGSSGLLIDTSPNFMVDHCIFTRCFRAGLAFERSPGGKVVHNTATACDVAQIHWRSWYGPSEDITIQYNSLNFQGNQMLSIQQPLETLRKKCSIDSNNYGTEFQKWKQPGRVYGESVPKPFPYLPSNRELHHYTDTTDPAKGVVQVFFNIDDWRKFSEQDRHTIFADPKWVDPKAGRFDVAKDSPNLLPDGKIIGACGYLGENPNSLPSVVVTAPCDGEKIPGTNLIVSADASDFDGTIEKVVFYVDGQPAGEARSEPYQATLKTFSQGPHEITAKATDDRGGETDADAVRVLIH